jgi:hypothetical protein
MVKTNLLTFVSIKHHTSSPSLPCQVRGKLLPSRSDGESDGVWEKKGGQNECQKDFDARWRLRRGL